MGEAVYVNTGGGDIDVRIVGEAESLNTGGRGDITARIVGEAVSVNTGGRRYRRKDCGGSSICEHGRQRYHCKDCGGSSICEHGRADISPQGLWGKQYL